METVKGKYYLKFPRKYRGDPNQIVFRSSWELRVMEWLDTNSKVKWWSSEPFAIPYVSPIDGKQHRYFPDFLFAIETKTGDLKEFLIEVKPEIQSRPPKVQKRKTKAYKNKVMAWGVNKAKWEAAKRLCEGTNVHFKVWTERNLFKDGRG